MYAIYKDVRAQEYKLKLTYFEGRGRAEHIRYLFAVGKRNYENHRLPNKDWKDLKPNTPFGMVPIMEADGNIIGGGVAIGRFVAKIVDLAGDDFLHQALVDSIVDECVAVREFLIGVLVTLRGQQSPDAKPEIPEDIQEKLDTILGNFEKLLADNDFFVANKLSYADVMFYASVEHAILTMEMTNFLEKYPKLQALYTRVADVPGIADHIANRPLDSW